MTFKQNERLVNLCKGKSSFSFFESGDVFELKYGDFMINAYQGNQKDGSCNNIYLRAYEDDGIKAYPLLGVNSKSKVSYAKDRVVFSGNEAGVDYKVAFILSDEGVWFWQVDLFAYRNGSIDFVYTQDLGVATKGGILTNELYMSQYLGHSIIEGQYGYTVSSRQNQSQGGKYPYLQQGCLNQKIVGYSTDATQFFGNDYRKTHYPKALKTDLPNVNYQYELSFIALQTEKFVLNGNKSFAFYGLFKEDLKTAINDLYFQSEIKKAYESIDFKAELTESEPVVVKKEFGAPFVSQDLSKDELNQIFPEKKLEEVQSGKLLSFFTPSHTHVVMAEKEVGIERPHGHIILTKPSSQDISKGLITSTNYMYGLFNAQVVCGNTSLNKLMSASRGFLNILKNSGQRIYVCVDNEYRLLTLPAAYEMGLNFSKWYYKIKDDLLTVTSFTVADSAELVLEVHSKNQVKYNFIITNQLVMGEHEFINPVNVEQVNGVLQITPHQVNPHSPYKNLNYVMGIVGAEYTFNDDRVFFENGNSYNGTLLTLDVKQSCNFQLIIEGNLETLKTSELKRRDFASEFDIYKGFYKSLINNFELEATGEDKNQIEKINEIVWWYTHNAMIHFSVPHGLEQPGGAAWGTRDVCQGPIEYFIATHNFELARKIIVKIFEHQYYENKEWPQWFMFDKYRIQAGDCHGDVVFWPIKCVGDYIAASGDYSILEEKCTFRHLGNCEPTQESQTILEHLKAAIVTIEERFLYGTDLISYAGGDWDDTLQPANEELKRNLVSAWTVALAYQVFKKLGDVCMKDYSEYAEHVSSLAQRIKVSFEKYLIKDDVIAGFAYFENDKTINYMLHPLDNKTGIKYRLLPLTRSIIAELVDNEQASKNVELIDEFLKCPDGVRLMDKPAVYDGGVCKYFVRAEQAANVGREISLQYVHAHIRYIEAMAKLGKVDEAWEALFKVNPINIKDSVPNTYLRQSNTYFSSSEGDFNDRYKYYDNFYKLKDGSIGIKGGWRIYSSGPGIYLNQVISNILGIRISEKGLIIDPVLKESLDGLKFKYKCFGKDVVFVYRISSTSATKNIKVLSNGKEISGVQNNNKYRNGGIVISKEAILNALETSGILEILITD